MKIQNYLELLTISMPIVFSSFIIVFINLFNTFIFGHYNIETLAATAFSSSIIMIIYNIFQASYTGYRILGSKAYGARKVKDINLLFNHSLVLGLFIACIIILFIFTCSNYVLNLISKDENIVNISNFFLKMGALCYPFIAITNTLSISLILQKKTIINMYLTLLPNIVYSITVFYIMFEIGTIHRFGIYIAYITLLQSIIVCILYVFIYPKVTHKKFIIQYLFDMNSVIRLWKLSYYPMISVFLDHINNMFIFSMISFYLSTQSLASARLCFSILLSSFSLINAASMGFYVIGGRALGEGNYTNFIKYYFCNININVALAIIISFLLLFMPNVVLSFLTIFSEVKKLAYYPLIVVAIICPIKALSYSNTLYLRLIENVYATTVSNLICLLFVQIPLSYYLGIILNLELIGFFLALFIYELMYFICTSLVIYKKWYIM